MDNKKLLFKLIWSPQGDCTRINIVILLYILEKNYINKTCRSCFEKMFLFMKVKLLTITAMKQRPSGQASDHHSDETVTLRSGF